MALLIKNGNTLVPVNTTNIAQQLSKLPQVVDRTVTSLTANDLQGVTIIGSFAFSYCTGLTSVIIPNSVTSIGQNAFYDCTGLTSITIPNSVTSIENYAFYDCTGLTSITIPNSVTSIGQNAFNNCRGLTSLIIPNSVTSIENFAFRSCSELTSVTIGTGVTRVGGFAFAYCNKLTSVVYEGQVPNIEYATFSQDTSVALYDFRNCTTIPTLDSPTALGHATNCQIVVPDALYDNWILATNWSALTDVVWVKASDYVE